MFEILCYFSLLQKLMSLLETCLFISSFMWCTLSWNLGTGLVQLYRKEEQYLTFVSKLLNLYKNFIFSGYNLVHFFFFLFHVLSWLNFSVVSLALICSFTRMRNHLGLGDAKPDEVSDETVLAVAETLRKSSFLKISEDGMYSIFGKLHMQLLVMWCKMQSPMQVVTSHKCRETSCFTRRFFPECAFF